MFFYFLHSKVLGGKLQKCGIFDSCGGLHVLAAQQLLVPLLARALFLGCTVGDHNLNNIGMSLSGKNLAIWE